MLCRRPIHFKECRVVEDEIKYHYFELDED